MKLLDLFRKNRDERIQNEINQIYRNGYLLMTVGIAMDLILQVASAQAVEKPFGFSARPVEFAVFIAVNIICLIQMLYKGLSDDNSRFAETDTFPHGHYLLVSLSAAVAAAIFFGAVYAWNSPFEDSVTLMLVLIGCGTIFLSVAASVYGLQYLCFRIARRRRRQLERAMEDTEE